jgi:hypothetical protein
MKTERPRTPHAYKEQVPGPKIYMFFFFMVIKIGGNIALITGVCHSIN